MTKAMEDHELINLWKAQNTQINQNISLNQNTLLETLRKKGKSTLWGLQVIRWVGIIFGIIWCLGIGFLVLITWNFSNGFFKTSLIIHLICTAMAVFLYAYHLYLLRVFNALPIAEAQKKLIALKNSNLKTLGILWLQLPVFSMWYISDQWMRDSPFTLWFIHFPIVLLQAYIGFWIYRNLDYKNHDKKWFRWFISQGEFKRIDKAISILQEIEELTAKNLPKDSQKMAKKPQDPWRDLLILDGGILMWIAYQVWDKCKPLIHRYLAKDVSFIESSTYQYQIHENLRIILENVKDSNSINSALKAAGALGIPQIYFVGNSSPDYSALKNIIWEYNPNIEQVIQELKNQDFIVIALQPTEQKVYWQNWTLDKEKKYALVFGNQTLGLSNEIMKLCDQTLEVPQFGSADLSLTLSIVIWEVVKRMN
jgi:hypothetical protein